LTFANVHLLFVCRARFIVLFVALLPLCVTSVQASVRANFGPSFIKRPDIPGVNAVSELQPMNPEDRKVSSRIFGYSCVVFDGVQWFTGHVGMRGVY
jgi:hypothetical protein